MTSLLCVAGDPWLHSGRNMNMQTDCCFKQAVTAWCWIWCWMRYCRCFDWGTVGWLLRTKRVDPQRYKYFVFLNSSVRGPFLPAYWPVGTC